MAGTATIDPKGGSIRVEVRIGFAQEGSYIVTLWDGNELDKRFEGNFLDPTDDSYELPGEAAGHADKLLQCRAELVIIPPIDQYSLLMSVYQDGKKVGSEASSGPATSRIVSENLFLWLRAG